MDPQKLSQLDPKLRDAYQRVMGTTIPEPQVAPALQRGEPASPQTSLSADLSAEALAEVEAPAKVEASAKAGTQVPALQIQPEPAPTPVSTPEPLQPEPTPAPNTEPAIPQAPTDQKREPFFIPQPTTNPQPEATSTPQTAIPAQQNSNFIQMNSEVSAAPIPPPASIQNFATPIQTTMAVKKKNGILMPMLIGITILVFLVVYSLFWAKIFNFKLPFLP